MIVVWLFLVVPWVCLQFVIMLFPDHTHYFCNFETRSDTLVSYKFGFFLQSLDLHQVQRVLTIYEELSKCINILGHLRIALSGIAARLNEVGIFFTLIISFKD